jgi:hypothetical protein
MKLQIYQRFLPILLFVLGFLAWTPAVQAQVGGGYTAGGLQGEYFANANLSGTSAFTRRELRLDFDWGTVLPIGGSNDPRYKNFPIDNFSARYTGKIIAAFTETYTFKLTADDGARLFIRPEGGSTWTTLIDQWSTAGTYTAPSALVKGTRYEIKVEYREVTGSAALRLLWSSPSTPEEVIDPVMNQGFNITYGHQLYADLAKSGRSTWETNGNGAVTQDANGWPQSDASIYVQESLNVGLDIDPLTAGTVTFSFRGRATVGLHGNFDSNAPPVTYDAATNTSSGTYQMVNKGSNASNIMFSNTDRDGQQPARKNGITDLKLMRAATPGGTTPYPDGTIFIDQARVATAKFTALRVNLNNANSERFWSDRTPGDFFNQAGGKKTNNYYTYTGGVDLTPSGTSNGASWEYSVMLANETGADLYINLPIMAAGWSASDTNGYVYKLAQLIRYGSDGINPYTAPTVNPVYPPLNPNLRVYVELSNEIWNSMSAAFRQYFDMNEMMLMDVRLATGSPTANDLVDPLARPADFDIYNFDKLPTTKDANGYFISGNTWRMRKMILRTVQISDIFRSIWGDANMGARVRPLYEWQYGNYNATASTPLKFVNDYFNNGDGLTHVATPHPVNYYIWGGGGASYYGAVNSYGVTDQLTNSSFESPVVASGYQATPDGAVWTFTGNAGIARTTGATDDIPPGWDSSAQCGYIAGTGSMSMQVTIPTSQTSNTYAFVFKALNRIKTGATSVDTQKVRLFVNGVLTEWKSFNQSQGYQPKGYDPSKPWNSFVVFWTPETPYYSSGAFTATPGSTVTLRIEGTAAADQIAFFEDVRLTSVDRMFADGFPGGGEAAGQPAGFGYQSGLNTQSSWALAYGLKYVTYEGGWSLGGDTGGTPMQNTGKFTSTDAAMANTKAINMFHQAGGYLNTYGTYSLWPNWSESLAVEGLVNVSQYPLISSQDAAMNVLPAEPTNGVFLPNSLTPGNAALSNGGTGDISGRNWVSWNVITTTTDTYTITLNTATGGSAQLLVDGVALGDVFTTGGATTRSIVLTKGIHGIRLQGISGSFALQSIALAIPGAPAAPSITTITDGSGSKIIEWAAVSGATGYLIRWGTESGVYVQSSDVTSGTTKTLTDLAHDQTYYFTITAYNIVGLGMPSPEVGSTALVDGLSGHLARWEFSGATGNEATMPPASSTSRLVIGNLARGPGLNLSSYALTYTADSFAYQESGTDSTTAADALAAGHYVQFSVTPKPGTTTSISSLVYAPYWQNSTPSISSIGIAYSINGGAYTLAEVSGTPSSHKGAPLTATLSDVAALQNLTVPVSFRLLQPNIGSKYTFAGIGRYSGDDIVLMGSVSGAGSQTVSFAPASPVTVGDAPVTLTASASSALTTFTFSTSSANSICAVSGNILTIVGAGTCALTATQAGSANYASASANANVVINAATVTPSAQTIGAISFSPATLKIAGVTAVSAAATSGLAVTYSSTTPTICSVSGSTVTGLLPGICTVAANQSGNTSYAAAQQVTQSITVDANPTFDVLAGWNLLGNGQDQPLPVASVFGDKLLVTSVWKWDVVASGWQFYTPSMDAVALQNYARGKGYGVLEIINAGEGFWVNVAKSFSVGQANGSAINAAAFQPGQPYALKTGWNLIANGYALSPQDFNRALSDPLPDVAVIPRNLITLWAWDAGLSLWCFYSPELDANGTLGQYTAGKGYLDFAARGKLLTPGLGFWVNKP